MTLSLLNALTSKYLLTFKELIQIHINMNIGEAYQRAVSPSLVMMRPLCFVWRAVQPILLQFVGLQD